MMVFIFNFNKIGYLNKCYKFFYRTILVIKKILTLKNSNFWKLIKLPFSGHTEFSKIFILALSFL